MNFAFGFLLIFFLSGILSCILPWWSFIALTLVVGCFFQEHLHGFIAGFLGVGLNWFLYALWLTAGGDNLLLAHKTGALLGGVEGFILLYISSLLGAILGGLGALTGTFLRPLLRLEKV